MDGMVWTVALSGTASLLGVTLGLLVALLALSGRPWLERSARVRVEGIRAIPLLVSILWVQSGCRRWPGSRSAPSRPG
ncbi:MAG: ABC transporter permease subunit [Geminicoccaceae bacterium]